MTREIMKTFVIFDHPADHPDHFVVRIFRIMPGNADPVPGEGYFLAGSLEDARSLIPPGSSCFPRSAQDDLVIVETWIPRR